MTKKNMTKKLDSKLIQDLSTQESEKIWGGKCEDGTPPPCDESY